MNTMLSSLRLLDALLVGAMLLAGTTVGCSDDDDGPAYESKTPIEACNDTVNAIAERLVSCEVADSADEIAPVIEAELGDCDDTDAVRDKQELYEDCIPEVESFECATLLMGEVPTACEGQILFEEE